MRGGLILPGLDSQVPEDLAVRDLVAGDLAAVVDSQGGAAASAVEARPEAGD
jgi:hypothetical protein